MLHQLLLVHQFDTWFIPCDYPDTDGWILKLLAVLQPALVIHLSCAYIHLSAIIILSLFCCCCCWCWWCCCIVIMLCFPWDTSSQRWVAIQLRCTNKHDKNIKHEIGFASYNNNKNQLWRAGLHTSKHNMQGLAHMLL